MDEVLIANWNEVVADDDLVYYLGDFTMARNAERYVERLTGIISFMAGSHDRWLDEAITRYEGDIWSKHRFIPPLYEIKHAGKHITLCHYAMRSWPLSFHGSYQLYGHSHGRLEATRQPRQMDIGVDCHSYYPVLLDDVLRRLDADEEKSLD